MSEIRLDEALRALPDRLAAAGIEVDAGAFPLFRSYLQRLVEGNRRMNLTAIRSPVELVYKHMFDSLTPLLAVPADPALDLVDLGSGGGLPGIPLRIARPGWRLTVVDSVNKKVEFVRRTALALGLDGVECVHGRAEELAAAGTGPLRERFDLALARAVAPLNVLVEWLLPLTRVGGVVLAMKGPNVKEELESARRAVELLGGGAPRVRELILPEVDAARSLIVIPKVLATPVAYPRRSGSARRHPL